MTWSLVERVTMLLGLLGLAFGAGENWHRLDVLTAQADELQAHQVTVEQYTREVYVRKDVLEQQLHTIAVQLQTILEQQHEARHDAR